VTTPAARRAYVRRGSRTDTSRTAALVSRMPFVVAVLALLCCGLACTLLLTTRSAVDSYQLAGARERNQELANQRAVLQQQVQQADSAPDLAARARDLGMIPARDPARLVVAADGAVTVIGKAVPAAGQPVPLLNPPLTVAPADPDQNERPFAVQLPQVSPLTTEVAPAPVRAPSIDVRAAGEVPVPVPVPLRTAGQIQGGLP
jgi:hypothetical protein